MKELLGHTIKKVYLSDDDKMVRFTVSTPSYYDGDIFYYAYGDCCSSSWFESISVPPLNGKGDSFKVLSVEDIGLPGDTDIDENTDDVLRVYGIKLQVGLGDIIIDYRNESNGYYGGSCEVASLDQIKEYDKENWKEWVNLDYKEPVKSLSGRYEQY